MKVIVGRRVCSGYSVGERNVWIVVARLLYCFEFQAVPVGERPSPCGRLTDTNYGSGARARFSRSKLAGN